MLGLLDKAVTFFEAAADKGESYAMNSLARLYAAGEGRAAEQEKAIEWYEPAARGGQPDTPINPGFIYRDGGAGRGQVVIWWR